MIQNKHGIHDSSLRGRVFRAPRRWPPTINTYNCSTTPIMPHPCLHQRDKTAVNYERKALVMKSILPLMLLAARSLPAWTLPGLRGTSLVLS